MAHHPLALGLEEIIRGGDLGLEEIIHGAMGDAGALHVTTNALGLAEIGRGHHGGGRGRGRGRRGRGRGWGRGWGWGGYYDDIDDYGPDVIFVDRRPIEDPLEQLTF